MSVLIGRYSGPFMLPKVVDVPSYPAPVEAYNAGGFGALTAAEPAGQLATYALQAEDFPTWGNTKVSNFVGLIWAAGKNNTAGAITVQGRILKNGASVANGSNSVAANYYFTLYSYVVPNVIPGDVLGFKLWGNTGFDYRYYAFAVAPCRAWFGGKNGRLLCNLAWSPGTIAPVTLTQGPSPYFSGTIYEYLAANDTGNYSVNHKLTAVSNEIYPARFFGLKSDYGHIRVNKGDMTQMMGFNTHAAYMPYYESVPKFTGTVSYNPTPIVL